MPVGLCVILTAVSTLFTFCPPGPEDLKKEMSMSPGFTFTSLASTTGITATEAVDV